MWVLTELGKDRLEKNERYIMDCMLGNIQGPPDNNARYLVRLLTYVDSTGKIPSFEAQIFGSQNSWWVWVEDRE